MRRFSLLVLAALALALVAVAGARPVRADPTFGLDATSPSLALIPGTPDDIFNPATGSPSWGGQPPPVPVFLGAAMGLPAAAVMDDFSYGDDAPAFPLALAYSVNRNAVGVPGTALAAEAMAPEGGVGADLYTPVGMSLPAPCGMPPVVPNALLVDGDGTTAGVAPLRLGLGLDELPPAVFAGQDNVSGLELENFMGPPIYFTLSAPTGILGVGGADILAWFGGGWVMWAPAGAFGLVPGDDIDALAVFDAVKDGLPFGPGDVVFLSLKPGSPSLPLLPPFPLPHCGLIPGPASPGDLWWSAGGGLMPAADAEMLGLATARSGMAPVDDNLDALDFVTFSGMDTDGDGADNAVDFDDDGDRLSDSREAALGTNPLVADTDGDGLTDGQEVLTYGTNPLNPDTDDDGYATVGAAPYRYGDGWEVANGENPASYCGIMRADVDSDGVVSILDLSRVGGQYGRSVPPAPARLDQFPPGPGRDNSINILDLSYQAGRYLQNVAACP